MASALAWAFLASCLAIVQPLMALPSSTGRHLSEASSSTCGSLGSACCGGDDDSDNCPAGWDSGATQTLACSRQTCVACGGPGDACCQRYSFVDPECDEGNVCASGKCKTCGDKGLPCCAGSSNVDLCPVGNQGSDAVFLRCDGAEGNGTCEKCGGVNEPCCQQYSTSEPSCDEGNVCTSGTCKACGDEGLLCCAGSSNVDLCPVGNLGSDEVFLRCDGAEGNGTCERCGGVSEPCCQQYSTSDPSCDEGNTCASGTCTGCGGAGLLCCPGSTAADQCPAGDDAPQALVCDSEDGNGTCTNCGKEEQACCQRYSTSDPECESGLNCGTTGGASLGQCELCGGVGQPCCESSDDDPCASGSLCSAGTCTECGGLGQPCCPHEKEDLWRMCLYAGHAACLEGVCTACGRPGEPCCTGDVNGRVTGVGTEAEDFVCWSGAACPDSRTCPPDAVPEATDADRQLCAGNYAEGQIGSEGRFFDACVGAAANTECGATVLADPAGSRIVPDWCLDFTANRSAPTFDCPAAAASGPPKYVYCSESTRTADCGNTFCQGGETVCDTWSPRNDTWTGLFALQPGSAGYSGSTPLFMASVACDGSLQILSRPGLGNALYALVLDGQLQTTISCIFTCVDIPLEILPISGTTVAWTATPGVPTAQAGATSKASATMFVADREGLHCIGPGVSYTATRTQFEVTCLLLDSPEDVPEGPLFPDDASDQPPGPSPDPPAPSPDPPGPSPDPPGVGEVGEAPVEPQLGDASAGEGTPDAGGADGSASVAPAPETASATAWGPRCAVLAALGAAVALVML